MSNNAYDGQSMLGNQASVNSNNSLAGLLKEKMQVRDIWHKSSIFIKPLIFRSYIELPIDDSSQKASNQ